MTMYGKRTRTDAETQHYQDIEKRLAAYYGPALPPRVLPEAAWLKVRAQLDAVQRVSSHERRVPWPGFARSESGQAVPVHLQEVFTELLMRADYRRPQPTLRCSQRPRLTQPRVRTSPLRRGQIQLILPERQALQPLEIEVLLAVGLARCTVASRTLVVLPRILVACGLLLAVAALPLATTERRMFWLLLAALACCVAGSCLLTWQRRVITLRADCQAVQWLGREQMCRGLHQLAEHGHTQRRPVWGEPSLAERIARVCGTSASQEDKHLTLVG